MAFNYLISKLNWKNTWIDPNLVFLIEIFFRENFRFRTKFKISIPAKFMLEISWIFEIISTKRGLEISWIFKIFFFVF